MAVDTMLETQVRDWIDADPDPETSAEASTLLASALAGDAALEPLPAIA